MKKYSHSYNYGSRINWRSLTIAFTLAFCFFIGSHADRDDTYVREPDVFMKPVVVAPEPTLEDKVKEYFPRSWKTMIAVAHAESGMSMEAIGYNCYYNNNETVVYEKRVKGSHSTACKKEHRKYSHSVDCFLLQKNYPGHKTCPEGVTVDMHLKEVAELSKVQGLQAWSSFNQNKHLKYLTQN